MQQWTKRLSQHGKVAPFDYPYMQKGRRAPDRLPVLIEAHREALKRARQRQAGRVVLVGKSMGGRVGCHLALEESVDGIVCLGYPLKGLGKAGKIRDEVLLELRSKILFVQGTRDNLCPLDLLDEVRKKMKAPNDLHVVEGGNHSLQASKTVLKQTGKTQEEVDEQILAAIAAFVA
jgi:predicted alpha/beta-hydrolase family hydrolase